MLATSAVVKRSPFLTHRVLVGATLMAQAASSSWAGSAVRLQKALDAVDPAAPPRVQLSYPAELEPGTGPRSLVVLDSSFNPPTRAHMHLLTSVMQRFECDDGLLLLAKQNADKPVVGASLVQRLQMMELLASDSASRVCCGVTGHPLFIDKAAALQALCVAGARVHMIVGFDTWIRITDPKYYPEGQMQVAVQRLLSTVDVVVASRDASAASNMAPLSVAEQEEVVRSLPAEIAQGRLHFLSTDAGLAQLSSSAVRAALKGGEGAAAASRDALPACLSEFVQSERLYVEGGEA